MGLAGQKLSQEKLTQNLRELSALYNVGQRLGADISLEEVIRAAVDGIVEATQADLVIFFLMTGQGLQIRGMGPPDSKFTHDATSSLFLGECLCGLAAREKKAVYSSDIHADLRCTRTECKKAGIRSFASLPLISEGRVIGVLGIASERERDFAEQALFMEAIAGAVSISLRNALLYERLRLHAAELEKEIADREQAEESLRQTQELLEMALAQSPSGILVAKAPDVTIQMANPAAFRIRGGDAQMLVGIEVSQHSQRWQTYRPDGSPYPPEQLPLSRAVLHGETTEDEEVIIRDEAGHDHWVSVNAAPLRNAQGDITAGIVIFHDISARKLIEQALRKEKTFSDSIINSLPGIFYLFDERGRFLRWNDNFEKISGYSGAEIAHMHPLDLFEGPDKDHIEQRIKEVFVSGKSDAEAYFVAKNGTRTPYYFTGLRIQFDELTCLLGVGMDITERRRAEKSLRDLSRAVNASGDIVFMTDTNGIITSINSQFTDLYGYSPEEVVGQLTPRILKSGRQNPEFYAKFWQTILSGNLIRGEVVNKAKDGQFIDLEETVSPFFNDRGDIAGFLAIQRNITQRKQAEAEIQHLAAFPQYNPNPTFEFTPDGQLYYCNPAAHRLAGELGFQQPAQLLPEEIPSISHDCLTTGRSRLRFETLVGDRVVSWSFYPISATGTVYGYVEDITELKKAEEALRTSEAHFRTLIENASDLVSVINQDGVIRFQGPSEERILGYPPETMTDRPAFDWIHSEDAPRVAAAIQRAMLQPNTPISAEFRFRHQDGKWRILESIGRNIPGRAKDGFIVVNSRDVTEHRRLEEQLRQSQKMEAIGQLAGGVAHDFNNMLAAMMMQAELLLNVVNDPEQVRTGLAQIQATVDRAANLTRQLLLFSRKQVMQAQNLDLNDIVTNLAKMLQRLIGEDVYLQLHLHPASLLTHADPGMLDQVLLNLTVNARDAMPHGGRLVITTSALTVDENLARLHPDATPGHYVCLSVSDTGHGIAPEILPHIFEPFFTTKEPGKGTGFGLATVFGIVKQHHGWLKVYSELNLGTNFQVFLPACPGEEKLPSVETTQLLPRGGSETILLVEDDLDVRRLTRAVLEHGGYCVIEAAHGREALQLWEKHAQPIHLLLTDLVMPEGLNGFELAAKLQERDPSLRVIFTSGYSGDFAGHELPLHPEQPFLQKPTAPHELLGAVRRCLDG